MALKNHRIKLEEIEEQIRPYYYNAIRSSRERDFKNTTDYLILAEDKIEGSIFEYLEKNDTTILGLTNRRKISENQMSKYEQLRKKHRRMVQTSIDLFETLHH